RAPERSRVVSSRLVCEVWPAVARHPLWPAATLLDRRSHSHRPGSVSTRIPRVRCADLQSHWGSIRVFGPTGPVVCGFDPVVAADWGNCVERVGNTCRDREWIFGRTITVVCDVCGIPFGGRPRNLVCAWR